jgi:hypothetical protein
VVIEMAENHGLDTGQVRLGWCGGRPEALPGGLSACSFARSSEVTAEVLVWVPLVDTPWGELGGLWVDATHAEPIDLYRSLD